MALLKCKECGAEVSDKAKICPQCGAPIKAKTSAMTKFALFLIFLILVAMSIPNDSTSSNSNNANNQYFDKAYTGSEQIKKSLRDPSSIQFINVIATDESTICYEFTAKNGFGGTNHSFAVFSKDNITLKTDEIDGYQKLWDLECANKAGTKIYL